MRNEEFMKYKAYFGIKYHEDNRNRDEIDSLTVALKNDGIEAICMVRDVEKWGDVQLSSQELMKIAFDEIDKSDFVILEMTEKGVGLGIEAGYAVAKGKPVIILTKEIQKLSNTMQGIANVVIQYSQPEEIEIFTHNKSLPGTLASLRP
jgi:nucleoside 2-deoxyribosyltransferase